MDPLGFSNRAFDRIAGRTFFRRWAESSLDALDARYSRRVSLNEPAAMASRPAISSM